MQQTAFIKEKSMARKITISDLGVRS